MVLLMACGPSKQDWIGKFEPAMVDWFCGAKQYPRNCFDLDETECVQMAKRALGPCIAQYEDRMPAQFDGQSGKELGELIGACAGGAYELELTARHKRIGPSPKCDTFLTWTNP